MAKYQSPDYVYFSSYPVKYVLMTSWHLNIWKVKNWLSQEHKEFLNRNKKPIFSYFKSALFKTYKTK